MMHANLKLGLLCTISLSMTAPVLAQDEGTGGFGTDESGPLPRWREGGTPYDSNQSLVPYAIDLTGGADAPAPLSVSSPPEYEPVRGVLYWFDDSQWPSVTRDLVVALTQDPAHDEIAYVVVTSTFQQNVAESWFTSAGADMSKVEFLVRPGNSIWMRDYGPHFVWQEDALGIVDSHYYPGRPQDNFIPTIVGDDDFVMPTADVGLYFSGGNFQAGPNRSGFVTSLIHLDNPSPEGFSTSLIEDLYRDYHGIDTLHILPQLPFSVDGTGHIDMWFYLVDEDTAVIEEFLPGSNPTAIAVTNNAVPYMEDLGFEVFRTRAWNVGGVHYTYANAFRVNDRIFIPSYGQGNPAYLDDDAHAVSIWEAAAGPGVEIIPINCYSIIPAAGAIHCIVKQVPRYTDPAPSVHVISPAGGETLISGSTHTIQWVATDTDNVALSQIDLYYSTNGGTDWQFIATTGDTGVYDWSVPAASSNDVLVRIVANSEGDSDTGEGVSLSSFQISGGDYRVYDFSEGAGVDRFAYGYQTPTWFQVAGDSHPVAAEVDVLVAGAYDKMSASDAVNPFWDPNRYRCPPVGLNNESTHTFEFTLGEDPAEIDNIEIWWEGYADKCTEVELYVWDTVAGEWGNGLGQTGRNYYMDSYAGNRDELLKAEIRSDFDRYIDSSGVLTFMVFAERREDETFHDYVAVIVKTMDETSSCPGDTDGSGEVDFSDLLAVITAWGPCGGCPEDLDQTGTVGFSDLLVVISNWGSCD